MEAGAVQETTAKLVDLFNVADTNRALFYTNGQNKQISDVTKFTDGYAITKFSNKTKAGGNGSNFIFPRYRTSLYLD